jgi:hypothetical protein
MAAAHEIETKGVRLADILLIPEPFLLDDAEAIAGFRRTRAAAASSGLSLAWPCRTPADP